MAVTNDHSKVADVATITTWTAWVLSNINQINGILQLFILLLGFFSGVFALAWHIHRWRKRS